MKTLLRLLVAFAVLSGSCACTPPEEDVHPKKRSSRSDNLKRYLPKAQELRALEQARSKPVVEGALVHSSALKEFLPKSPDTRISAAVSAQRVALQNAVREEFARRAAEKISVLLRQFEAEAVSSAQTAQTPQELAARVEELNAHYNGALTAVGQEENSRSWSLPDKGQSRLSKQDLQQVFKRLSAELERDYGAPCAKKAEPVLRAAADGYALVLSSVKTPEDLEEQFARVGREADEAFAQVAAQYGDPALILSAEDAASLKARMISAHQQVEQEFEKLYGKDAVLQARALFERYLNGAETLLAAPGRLSSATEQLDALNAAYREDMAALQVKLNEDLEQKLLAARIVRPL
uniref:Lipoprotein n=1 Tax=uncultured Elusimicrobia bacterium TaxID=699876 RepID=A0A650F3N4_9BACT|nr:hypothetical protein Elusimicrob1349_0050 [uncultured Elusimicrobia bacterium]